VAQKYSQELTPTPAPIGRPNTQSDKLVNDLQNVVVEKTTDEEIEKISGVKLVSSIGNKKTYEISSIINSRPHQITTTNGLASGERIIIPVYQAQTGFVAVSEVIEKYGQPEKITMGSFYGDYTSRYLYPTKGINFTVNTNTNEVLEIFHYSFMSVPDFEKKFPEEIREVRKGEERF
jgi:hypothetical protein